jgi:indolepyruvate decarboxylase
VRVGTTVYDCVPLRAFMERLLQRLREKKYGAPAGAVKTLAAVGAPEQKALTAEEPATKALLKAAASPPVTYDRFFRRMNRWVDDGMILMADTTIALYSAAELPVNVADGFIAQAAWNSIGYTTGACLGVGFADPARRPVVFTGDGGFQMVAQALSDVVRAKHGAIVFIFDNELYGIEQAFVNVKYFTQGEPAEDFDLLHGWDYARLTDVFHGGWSATVTTMKELDAALKQAKANTDTLSLITLKIPQKDITRQMLALAGS